MICHDEPRRKVRQAPIHKEPRNSHLTQIAQIDLSAHTVSNDSGIHMTVERREITSREEWLEWRKQDVTASQVGALFNCHPYVTALRLYAEKRGTEFFVEDNKVMRRGRWLEPAVAKAVEELRPEWQLIPAHEYLRDAELHLGATPDFYVIDTDRLIHQSEPMDKFKIRSRRGILQTKTVAPSVYARDWADGAEVPLWIILQATVEAMLADADFIAIAALLVDAHAMDCAIHELPRNPAAEQKIKDQVAIFWRNVDQGIEPEPNFERDADVIKAMWRHESEPTSIIDLSGDNRIPELLAERATLKASEKAVHDRIEFDQQPIDLCVERCRGGDRRPRLARQLQDHALQGIHRRRARRPCVAHHRAKGKIMTDVTIHQNKPPIIILKERLEAREDELRKALTDIDPKHFIRTIITAAQINPDIQACSWQSLWLACLRACRDNLLPDGVQGAIVPFKSNAQWIPMYRGLLKRFRASGECKWITANVVREGEVFEHWITETGEHFKHVPGASDGVAPVEQVYAAALTSDGAFYVAVMTMAEINKIKASSKASREDSPWRQWPDEMMKKTALRRLKQALARWP